MAVKKYVAVDDLLKHQRKMRGFGLSSDEEFWDFAVLVEDINNTPAADVEEVQHGHWIKGEILGLYTCSVCGHPICGFDANIKKTKRCNDCGAKMDEECEG